MTEEKEAGFARALELSDRQAVHRFSCELKVYFNGRRAPKIYLILKNINLVSKVTLTSVLTCSTVQSAS